MIAAFSFANFHESSVGSWTRCERPSRTPDFVSPSGSCYWNEGAAVIRAADHWCWCRSCRWLLEGAEHRGAEVAARITYSELALQTAEHAVEVELGMRAGEARLARRAELQQPGRTVRITRNVSSKVGRRFVWSTEQIVVTIEKLTASFLVAVGGRRFGLQTITSWEAA